MMDLVKITPSTPEVVQPGHLFVPVVRGGNRFLGGLLDQTPVLVVLEGEDPFSVGAPPNTGGFVVADTRFQVDITSACPALEAKDVNGALVMGKDRSCSIIGHNRDGRYAICLQPGETDSAVEKGDIAFISWRIVAGEGRDETELYSFKAAEARPSGQPSLRTERILNAPEQQQESQLRTPEPSQAH